MDGFVFSVIVILGIVKGIFLSVILWINKKGNQPANRLLSPLILLMGWHHLQSISILRIAHELCFNNRVSFNTQFKSVTALTPTAYRKENTGERVGY